MSELSEQLKERSMLFAVSVLRLIEHFPPGVGAQVVARQLAKSATSVAANYRAACSARSDAEFVAKLCLVHEEADETVYWLELAARAQLVRVEKLESFRDEAIQLRAIFGRSLQTIRRRVASSSRKMTPQLPNDPMTR